jgi:hypothetical protein
MGNAADTTPATDIPSLPSSAILAEVAVALERAADLIAADRELHFQKNPDTDRIEIELRNRWGEGVGALSLSDALDVMAGLIEP